ncbi:MAG: hypothetical protein K6E51_04520 [Treponema sp.]|nr:hypothetical protein [Treponema sp.]
MKNFLKAITVLAATAIVCTSCASTKVDYLAESEEKTPENSVVMIFLWGYGHYDLAQINPEFDPDLIEITLGKPWTTPMTPGALYFVKELRADTKGTYAGTPCLPGELPFAFLNVVEPGIMTNGGRLEVPTEPGVHLVTYFNKYSATTEDSESEPKKEPPTIVIGKYPKSMEDLKTMPYYKKGAVKTIKKAAQYYAGTPWEDAINEKLKEWEE